MGRIVRFDKPVPLTAIIDRIGLGLVLVTSPWFWPRPSAAARARPPGRVRDRLTQAGLDGIPPLALVAVSLLVGVLAAGVALALVPVVAVAGAALVAGAAAPLLAVRWRARCIPCRCCSAG